MNDMLTVLRLILVYVFVIPFATNYILKKFTKEDAFGRVCYSMTTTIFLLIAVLSTDMINQSYKYYTTRNVVAMNDSLSYVVSRFSVDSELKYFYMTENDGAYKALSASSDKSIIRYTTEQPKVVVNKKQKDIEILNWITPNHYRAAYRYEFYIPNGSIKEAIMADLE